MDDNTPYGVSLLERLQVGSPVRSVTKGPDPADVLDSIKRNLSQILNARLGESQSAPDLGLIDFNDASLASVDLAIQIKRAIEACIYKFEPRVSYITIDVITDDNSATNLSFQLQAKINLGAMHSSVQIELLLDNSRQYRVL